MNPELETILKYKTMTISLLSYCIIIYVIILMITCLWYGTSFTFTIGDKKDIYFNFHIKPLKRFFK